MEKWSWTPPCGLSFRMDKDRHLSILNIKLAEIGKINRILAKISKSVIIIIKSDKTREIVKTFSNPSKTFSNPSKTQSNSSKIL